MVFSSCTGSFFEAPDQTAFDEDTLFEKIENVRRLFGTSITFYG